MSQSWLTSSHAGRVSGGSGSTRRSGISYSPWSTSSEKKCGTRSESTRSTRLPDCKVLSASCNFLRTNICQCTPGLGRRTLQTRPTFLRLHPHPFQLLPLSLRRKTHKHFRDKLRRRSRRHRASSQAFYSGHSPHYSSSIPRDETWHSISPDNLSYTDSEPESDESLDTDSSCSSCSSIASLSTLEDMPQEANWT